MIGLVDGDLVQSPFITFPNLELMKLHRFLAAQNEIVRMVKKTNLVPYNEIYYFQNSFKYGVNETYIKKGKTHFNGLFFTGGYYDPVEWEGASPNFAPYLSYPSFPGTHKIHKKSFVTRFHKANFIRLSTDSLETIDKKIVVVYDENIDSIETLLPLLGRGIQKFYFPSPIYIRNGKFLEELFEQGFLEGHGYPFNNQYIIDATDADKVIQYYAPLIRQVRKNNFYLLVREWTAKEIARVGVAAIEARKQGISMGVFYPEREYGNLQTLFHYLQLFLRDPQGAYSFQSFLYYTFRMDKKKVMEITGRKSHLEYLLRKKLI